jgi:glycosyltransferase involved in cell wall biosynthesis
VTSNPSILVYEPRTEGHHPGWLAFVVEDLLAAGANPTLAVDLRPSSKAILQDYLGEMWGRVAVLDAYDGRLPAWGGAKWRSLRDCFTRSQAERIFLCAFDAVASDLFRCAAFGWNPLASLSGKIGGIYHRPRFMDKSTSSWGRMLKRRGFSRLLREDFFSQLLMLDEFLVPGLRKTFPQAPLFFLPDPCPIDFQGNTMEARAKLGLPSNNKVLLFFGVGSPRKGLGVAADAVWSLPVESNALLLVAGKQDLQGPLRDKIVTLVQRGRAHLIDRYVSSNEEKWCFQAADAVLLPYLNHFGTSGVLSRACATGKFVMASDEQLIGKLVEEHGLGFVFTSGNSRSLASAILDYERLGQAQEACFRGRAADYAKKYSRAKFREALLASLDLGPRETF